MICESVKTRFLEIAWLAALSHCGCKSVCHRSALARIQWVVHSWRQSPTQRFANDIHPTKIHRDSSGNWSDRLGAIRARAI